MIKFIYINNYIIKKKKYERIILFQIYLLNNLTPILYHVFFIFIYFFYKLFHIL